MIIVIALSVCMYLVKASSTEVESDGSKEVEMRSVLGDGFACIGRSHIPILSPLPATLAYVCGRDLSASLVRSVSFWTCSARLEICA